VPLRFLSREELSGFPAELDAEALDRFFTLSDADLVEVHCRHGDSNRLGWALQLCGLQRSAASPAPPQHPNPDAITSVRGIHPCHIGGGPLSLASDMAITPRSTTASSRQR
jgi:hypothetical protein